MQQRARDEIQEPSEDEDEYMDIGTDASNESDDNHDEEDSNMDDEESEDLPDPEPPKILRQRRSNNERQGAGDESGKEDPNTSQDKTDQIRSGASIADCDDGSEDNPRTDWDPLLRAHYDVTDIVKHSSNPNVIVIIEGGQSPGTDWFFMRDTKTAYLVEDSYSPLTADTWDLLIHKATNLQNLDESIPVRELLPGTPTLLMVFSAITHSKKALVEDMELQLEDIAELAKLSCTYKKLSILAPWIPKWTEEAFDDDDIQEERPYQYHQEVEKIWIAYEFGLEEVFLKTSFQLAFQSSTLIPHKKSLPPGLHERIYACRSAYILEALKKPWACLKDLRDAKARGGNVSSHICRKKSRKCLQSQLEALEYWFYKLLLPLEPVSLEDACKITYISPLQICVTDSLNVNKICKPVGKTKCRLGVLADFLNRGGTGGYRHYSEWSLFAGDKARPVTEEHIKYMQAQRETILQASKD